MNVTHGRVRTDPLVPDLETRFTYHAPYGTQPERYERLRAVALDFARLVCELAPDSRERSLAVTNLEQSVMWANAAIARREQPVLREDDLRIDVYRHAVSFKVRVTVRITHLPSGVSAVAEDDNVSTAREVVLRDLQARVHGGD